MSTQNNSKPSDIKRILFNAKNPVCFIDSRIDMDAFCSAISLFHVLKENAGITLKINYFNQVSRRFYENAKDLIEVPDINNNIDPETYDFSKHDVMIFLDTGSFNHISPTYKFLIPANLISIDIDHHESNKRYGNYNYVKSYGSACTVLYELFKKWKVKMDKNIYNAILMAITLDTGFYQYNTTTPFDFAYSSELMKLGADHYKMMWQLTFNEDIEDTKMIQLVYKNLVLRLDMKTAYSHFTQEDLKKAEININDSVIAPADVIKKIKGTEFVFVVREVPEESNLYNVSVRSHLDNYNSLTLVKALNPISGGHVMAAGTNINANTIEDAINKVLETAKLIKFQENS